MLYTQYKTFKKNNYFVVKRPKTGLGLNSLKYLGPKLQSNVPEIFENLKKDQFKYSYKKFFLSKYTE